MSSGGALRVVIVGAGLMGAQIGCEYALGGHSVRLVSRRTEGVEQRVDAAFATLLELGLADAAEATAARARLLIATDPGAAEPAPDLLVESLPEDIALKTAVLVPLTAAWPETIFASNTSSIPIGTLGDALGAPGRTIGTHYWNPPLLMPPVEIVIGPGTDPVIAQWIEGVIRALGKEPVLVQRDVPGFIWNRLQLALLREALWLVEEGVATPEAVDAVVRSGLARRARLTGPFETVALGGVDAWQSVATNLFPVLCNADRPAELSRWTSVLQVDLDEVRRNRDRGLARALIDDGPAGARDHTSERKAP